jgi:hypothetical protein
MALLPGGSSSAGDARPPSINGGHSRAASDMEVGSNPGLLESGLGSKRANTDRAVDPELKNREISFLTRILGRMTPILLCILKNKTPNIVHKGPVLV